MSTKNEKAALDVIGKTLKLKAEIDQEFDENELKDVELGIEENTEKEVQKSVVYKLNTPDVGFNCICELNLGKAYKYSCVKDEEGNIVSEKRTRYPNSYKQAMNEKWLDFTLTQIKEAANPIVVISDIFTRVTTGNSTEMLPYKEQLAYIYKKLNDETLKGKIVALVRGTKEMEIINNGGPDLMKKLAKMLGLENRLVDSGVQLSINTNKQGHNKMSLKQFSKKASSVKGLAESMQKFAHENPGHDVYFCTNSRLNWMASGTTTVRGEDGAPITKPCWFISFGPMYEYDKLNEKRPELGPYTLNKEWYKLSIDENGFVRADCTDYIFPHSIAIDTSSYTASVLSEYVRDSMKDMFELGADPTEKMLERVTKQTRKNVVSSVKNAEKITTKKVSKPIERIEQPLTKPATKGGMSK